MSSVKDYLFDVENERAEKWIRERAGDSEIEEESEEWNQLANEYSEYQDHLFDEAERAAEIKWLKENGSSNIHQFFENDLSALKLMATNNLGNNSKIVFMLHSNIVVKMSYIYAVSLLEAFLGDTLKYLITEQEKYLYNAIKHVEEVSKVKYSIADLAGTNFTIPGLVLKHISEVLFHNIPKVIKIYEQVLGTKLNIEISKISKITALRHDIAHRNGKSKDDESINLTPQDLFDAIEDIKNFASSLQKQINAL